MIPEKYRNIIAGVVMLALAGVLVYQFVLNRGPLPPPSLPAPTTSPAAQAQRPPTPGGAAAPVRIQMADVDIPELLREVKVVNFDYEAERIDRNPMNPLVGYLRPGMIETPAQSQQTLFRKNVTGIIWDQYNPMAVVDNEVVSVGYTYPSGIQVYAIEPNRVIFRINDALIPVEMKEL
jgi:hypothetical protein